MYSMSERYTQNTQMLRRYLFASAITLQDTLIQGDLPGTDIIIKMNCLTKWGMGCFSDFFLRRHYVSSLLTQNSEDLLRHGLDSWAIGMMKNQGHIVLYSISPFNNYLLRVCWAPGSTALWVQSKNSRDESLTSVREETDTEHDHGS